MYAFLGPLALGGLPYARAEQVVIAKGTHPQSFVSFRSTGFRLLPELAARSILSNAGLYLAGHANLAGTPPERLPAAAVTPEFFVVLGVTPSVGRVFTATDLAQDPKVCVISHRLWVRRCAGDPGIVGRALTIDGIQHTVLAVLPPRVDFPDGAQLWVPGTSARMTEGVASPALVVRLLPGTSVQQLRAELAHVEQRRGLNSDVSGSTIQITAFATALTGDTRAVVLLCVVAALLLLLVAAANVSGMQLSRLTARDKEFAVRHALGETHASLAGNLLAENLLVSAASAVSSIPVTMMVIGVLKIVLPPSMYGVADAKLDDTTLLATAGLAFAVSLAAGASSAAAISADVSLSTLFGARVGKGQRSQGWLRSALVVLQISVAVVLVETALTCVGSVRELLQIDLGVRADHVLIAEIALPSARYASPQATRAYVERLDTELRRLPGIEETGVTNYLPGESILAVEGRPIEVWGNAPLSGTGARSAVALTVSPGYFRAIGIDLICGRTFSERAQESRSVVVVSEGYAKALGIPSCEVVGRLAVVNTELGKRERWGEIVGVVHDVRLGGPYGEFMPAAYTLFGNETRWVSRLRLVMKTARDYSRLVARIREAGARIDADVPLHDLRSFDDVQASYFWRERFAMRALGLFGVVTIVVAATGLYGVIAHSVSRRTREFGIRMALGATRSSIGWHVIGQSAIYGLGGVCVGGLGSFPLLRALSTTLLPLGAPTVSVHLITITVTLLVTVVASWVPGVRATRVDPAVSLRAE